jgi:hypothetical protein
VAMILILKLNGTEMSELRKRTGLPNFAFPDNRRSSIARGIVIEIHVRHGSGFTYCNTFHILGSILFNVKNGTMAMSFKKYLLQFDTM